MSILKMLARGSAARVYVDDVFSAYTRNGTGASAAITTGINLSLNGGCVWTKSRSAATGNRLQFTAIGAGTELATDSTAASASAAQGVTSFNTNGHTIGTDTDYNNATGPATYIDWTFRNAPNFYWHTTVTKSAGTNATYNFSMHTAGLGMVRVKRTDSTGSWYVWHRSLTAGKLLIGESTAAEATLGQITVSGTTVTLVDGVIADGTYLVEAIAHDTSATGIIQCGTFTTDVGATATVMLGWESQYVMLKRIDGTVSANWNIHDIIRGANQTSGAYLYANTAGSEVATRDAIPYAQGFKIIGNVCATSAVYVYLAIRRPNKPPTNGTQVYNAIARTGTGAAASVTGVGFAPDLVFGKKRTGTTEWAWTDRLRGATLELSSDATTAETAFANDITSFGMDGVIEGSGSAGNLNANTVTEILQCFRRAPGVFDQICTTGSGANKTESHNLTVAPELWLHKGRSGTTGWIWGSSLIANTEYIAMPSPNGVVTDATAWNSTYPTASVINFGTLAAVNTSSATYVTYLWATKAGISKVFSYTGDGGSGKIIDCGFTTGARFVMIIRTAASTAQDIFVWDSVRGIVAGNDPHLSLNTTAAEVTTDDSIDPDASGFAVNQVAATNINVNGAVYIGVAYS